MFPADALELYLAKTGGAWLDTDGAKAVALDEDGKVPGFDVMDPTSALKNPKCIGDDFERKDGDIHVLVVVPDGAENVHRNICQSGSFNCSVKAKIIQDKLVELLWI
ncbi:unnamed protein product [Aphanomyces euteiches]